MTFPTTCSRLRLGGSISGSVLSGGTTIDAGGIAIQTWDGLLQFPGMRGTNLTLLGSDGEYHRENKPYLAKTMTLNFVAYGRDATATVTSDVWTHLESNLDSIMELIAGAGEQAILERDMEDGTTRWIKIQPLVGAVYTRGPLFDNSMGSYRLPVVVTAAYPFWQSETLHSQVVAVGADTIVNAGNARISNAIYTFSGAGTFTNSDDSYDLVATAACTVDCGTRQISNAGSPTPGRLDPPDREWWMRLGPGTTNVAVAANAVTVQYRDHWH